MSISGKKTELTFYDPKMASKELVDELYETVNVRIKAIKIIALAKNAIRNNLGKRSARSSSLLY
jgi:2-hydroxy-6-oxonona-2,4-dienedioate hydrolase